MMRDMMQEERIAEQLSKVGPEYWKALDMLLNDTADMDPDLVQQAHMLLMTMASMNPNFYRLFAAADALLLAANMGALEPTGSVGILTVWGRF